MERKETSQEEIRIRYAPLSASLFDTLSRCRCTASTCESACAWDSRPPSVFSSTTSLTPATDGGSYHPNITSTWQLSVSIISVHKLQHSLHLGIPNRQPPPTPTFLGAMSTVTTVSMSPPVYNTVRLCKGEDRPWSCVCTVPD